MYISVLHPSKTGLSGISCVVFKIQKKEYSSFSFNSLTNAKLQSNLAFKYLFLCERRHFMGNKVGMKLFIVVFCNILSSGQFLESYLSNKCLHNPWAFDSRSALKTERT